MLEHIPSAVGAALSGLKAGAAGTVAHATFPDIPDTIALTSPAFAEGTEMPARFTADGEGLSPPLAWSNLPAGTGSLILLVEDAGSPTPRPLVHLIAWDIAPEPAFLREGALPSPGRDGDARRLGRNSFQRAAWLPPDPPSGHGRHDYVFQIFALRQSLQLAADPGRGAVIAAMRGHVVAKGQLVGTYARP